MMKSAGYIKSGVDFAIGSFLVISVADLYA